MIQRLHPTTIVYTFFLGAYGAFPRTDHVLGYRLSLNRFEKINIIQSILSGHNRINLEINNKSKTEKFTKLWKLNNTLLNSQQLKEEITRKIRKYLDTNEKKNTAHQNLCDTEKAVLRGQFIAINAYTKKQERENQQTNFIT